MAKVFVANYAGHDLSDAERFGELIYVTEGNVNVFNTDRMMFTILKCLKDNNYDPDKDYILLSGSMVINFLIGLLCTKSKLLIWDPKIKQYEEREAEYDPFQVRYFNRQTA